MSYIYLPIETKSRDLEGRLLLIYHALQRDFNAVLLHKSKVRKYLPYMPKGIYIHYGVHNLYHKELSFIKNLGHKVFAWDEEGLVFHKNYYFSNRISVPCMELLEKFFAWGEYHKDYIVSHSEKIRDKMAVTGHPRFDLLNKDHRRIFDERAELIKSQYGRIILINTRFSMINHFKGKDYALKSLRAKGYFQQDNSLESFNVLYEHDKRIFAEFFKAVQRIADEFPAHRVILRPHPSENAETWKEAFKHLKNFDVVHDGNVINWIMASDAVIHNNCTTSVESFMLDKVAIAFRPFISEEFDPYLPNELSINAYSIEELIGLIRKKIDGWTGDDEFIHSKSDMSGYYIRNTNGKLGTEKILDQLQSFAGHDSHNVITSYQKSMIFMKSMRERVSTLVQEKILHGPGVSYSKHKFPGLNKKEITEIFEKLDVIYNRNGNQIKIKQIGDFAFSFHINK